MRDFGAPLALMLVACGAGCGSSHHEGAPDAAGKLDAPIADAMVDAMTDADPDRPATLAGTGLCLDDACMTINPNVYEYEPQWPLWADGATKRRWISIPAGATIDTTTDPDNWIFPVGTRIWKEFSQDGAKVETRFMINTGEGSSPWYFIAYQWNLAGTATMAVPDGVFGANGTIHDIPSQHECIVCHQNAPNTVLGFGALQLDFTQTTAGLLDLDAVAQLGWLDKAPPGATTPHYPLPTGTGAATAIPALGYIHANCSHCHNPTSPVHDVTGLEMHLRIADTTLTSTEAYSTLIDTAVKQGMVNGDSVVVVPGDAAHSVLVDRISSTDPQYRMPELGSNVVDPTGVATITAWINAIPPD
jgi:hypothetical protein